MDNEQTTNPEPVKNRPIEAFPDCTAIRNSKELTLENLSSSTKIRISYLQAIENGKFEVLPEPIYAEKFIKTYAQWLGLDESILLSHYRQYLNKSVVSRQEPIENQVMLRKYDLKTFKVPLRATGWFFSVIIVIGFLISFFTTYMADQNKPATGKPFWENASSTVNQKPNNQSVVTTTSQGTMGTVAPSVPTPGTAQSVSPVVSSPVQTSGKAPAKVPYKLVVEATETSWLNVVEDDNPPYEILLRPGERMQREATDKFSIDIGNAGGVSVYFQDKPLGLLGKSGQVVHLNLPGANRD
jgi:cytoskeletal protein RodZ